MLGAMIQREFLGWDRPFLPLAVNWLLARRETLSGTWVVVPTAQSGRRLREAMAAAAGAVLAPKVVTPGAFLKAAAEGAAENWIEQVAWVEVLEEIGDWSEFSGLFPEAPDRSGDWATALAREFAALRHALQENGLMLATAARRLRDSVEAERWDALGRLEERVERKIRDWGSASRSRMLAEGISIPADVTGIVLAGVAELPPLLERALAAWPGPITALIGAPAGEAEHFSKLGTPLAAWSSRVLPWPENPVRVVADPRQQAVEALRAVGAEGTPSDEVALGTADTAVGDELARAFTREGWPAFHPATTVVTGGLARWFKVWREWLRDPSLANLADLLALPETGVLVGGKRAQKAKCLAGLRDQWMIFRTEDLQRRIGADEFRSDFDRTQADELCRAAESLETWRSGLLGERFPETLWKLLEALSRTGPESAETANQMIEWLGGAAPVMERLRRGAGFWIDLMLADLSSPAPTPPPGRVLDVQGWLELFHEPGRHLVLCGMNDGKVPSRGGGEPWLGERIREKLGLIRDEDRAGRDAFLFQSMLEARRDGGRVDVICGKSGPGGEPLLPSRLLLAGSRDELPARVNALFKEVEPPEAGLRWEADWRWKPKIAEPPQRLGVTSLRDYLACPFRYYLKYVLGMQKPEPGRGEWNARDFGTVAHEVLERWGRDTEAREFEKTEALHDWFSAELDRVVAAWFGKRVPLAIRIQTESLRQRFLWLARVQAVSRVEGWEVIDIEHKFELPAGEAVIVAKIDRIDRHRDTGCLRVLDYKTGKIDGVAKAHRKKVTNPAKIPAHLGPDSPALYLSGDQWLWTNLQLPLYASAIVRTGEPLPAPCYFTLGPTESKVAIHEWDDFETADLAAAETCAEWLAGRISQRIFYPPAEKVAYDDFATLAAGRTLEEMVDFPPVAMD